MSRHRQRRVGRGVAALLLICAPFGSCRSRNEPPLTPTRGLILISLDTLRADHLGAYGYESATSPFLDSLAARGTLFERVWAQYPSTLTSHMSLFTGLYPQEHGVLPPDGVLSAAIPTVPELLRRHGLRTGGFTEGGLMRGNFGFARGFERFSDRAERTERDIETTLARGLDFLDGVGPQERFFLFLHTYVVHAPYAPPEPYDTMFWPGPRPDAPPPETGHLQQFNRELTPLASEIVDYYRSQYDGSIRYMDDRLREFFGEVERRGLMDEVTVVVLSDHGEEFREHGEFAHAQIYDETLHVPLLVVRPDGPAGQRVEGPAELVDVTPTLLDLAGVRPPEGLSGSTLVAALAGARPDRGDGAYAEVGGPLSQSLLVRTGEQWWHLVRTRIAGGPQPRRLVVDLPASTERLRLRGYESPRQLRLTLGGRDLGDLRLGVDWTSVPLPPADGRRRRLVLEADSCTTERIGRHKLRCFAFETERGTRARLELFELTTDPAEQRDLSWRESDRLRSLVRRLDAIEFAPRAATERQELGATEERELKALGYLD